MAKKEEPSANDAGQKKVQTKYDRKMEARKQQKIKDQKQERLLKLMGIVIGVIVVAAVLISIALPIIQKNRALKGTYVKIGDHDLTQLEYDYYYESTVNNYMTTYSSLLPYMGLDTSVDFDKQQYSDEMTWKDMFDQMTVTQIQQTKGLVDDGQTAGFTYDATEEYDAFVQSVKEAADNAGISEAEYYSQFFGPYATKENIAPFIKDGMYSSAYYNDLLEKMAPSQDEIDAYYKENVLEYDKVDFRSFTFTTGLGEDASEEEIEAAMGEAEKKANAMLEALEAGEDFEQLCIENAPEDQKADYEAEETEHCLSEGRYYSGVTAVMAEWLYADGRTEGERAVLRDDNFHQYHVVEFISRYYDKADDEKISSQLASDSVLAYMEEIQAKYPVTDVAGKLNYLTLDLTTQENAE